ncbi:hypothetical protein [Paenibacillus oenotherae]|nr:hypothetical protein [Paenibacillus oenotherae]
MKLEKTDQERQGDRLYKVFLGISISSAIVLILIAAGCMIYKYM